MLASLIDFILTFILANSSAFPWYLPKQQRTNTLHPIILDLLIIVLNGTETSHSGQIAFIYCEKKPKNDNAAIKLEKRIGYIP